MARKLQLLIFCVLLFIRSNLSANILAVTTLASPSHHLWHKAYFLGLLKNGHNITVLGHDEEKEKITNFTMLTLEGVYDKIHEDFILEDLSNDNSIQSILNIWLWDELLCKYDSETQAFKTLLNYPKDYKFDLIIWDINGGRCLYPMIDIFGNPPVIATSPFGLQPFIDYTFGNHIFSYIPFYYVYSTDRMNILERLKNFFHIHFMNLSRRYYLIPREFALAKKIFGNKIRRIEELERDMSLLLVNNDPLAYYPEPLPPNIIPVAGIHIQPVKKLPKEIEKILNEATNGVILVIFGTNLNWSKFGEIQKKAFYEAFRKLPQTILMKSPALDIDLPKNVIIKDFLPQNDILAHSNVKLFITHGGALSTQEALYHGVPIIGMPFYLDQHGNMVKIDAMKLGKNIDYFRVTSDVVYETITEVLHNPIYRNNIQSLSKKFKDQPQTPLERAVFWTEYILRHGTAEHLNPASRDMSVFQRYDLDNLAIFNGIMIFLIIIFYKLVIACLGLCVGTKRALKDSRKFKRT